MKLNVNETLQWLGAVFIIAGHSLNASGPEMYPWNIVAFFIGTSWFTIWGFRVRNVPQSAVNIVAFLIGITGMIRGFS